MLPGMPPQVATRLATGAEHLFLLLLVMGLRIRISALALLGMAAAIEVFIYLDT